MARGHWYEARADEQIAYLIDNQVSLLNDTSVYSTLILGLVVPLILILQGH